MPATYKIREPDKMSYITKPLPIPDIPINYDVISSDIILINPSMRDKPVYNSLALLRRARDYEYWLVSQAGIITL